MLPAGRAEQSASKATNGKSDGKLTQGRVKVTYREPPNKTEIASARTNCVTYW
jgi:hypothetical protein